MSTCLYRSCFLVITRLVGVLNPVRVELMVLIVASAYLIFSRPDDVMKGSVKMSDLA